MLAGEKSQRGENSKAYPREIGMGKKRKKRQEASKYRVERLQILARRGSVWMRAPFIREG